MEKQMDNKQYYHFKKGTSAPNVTTSSEHFYICEEDARWDDVMRQFAAFLDSSGYVGVFERIDALLDEVWEE
jgi:hypothetical protein